MTDYINECIECKNTECIKEDYNDGSYVCIQCGLVQSDCLMKTRPYLEPVKSQEYDTQQLLQKQYDIYNICSTFKFPEYIAMNTIDLINQNLEHINVRGSNMNYLKAACFLLESSLTHAEVACMFRVSSGKLLLMLKNIKQKSSTPKTHLNQENTPNKDVYKFNRIIGLILESVKCPEFKNKKNGYIQAANKIASYIFKTSEFVNIKPSKIDIVIMFIICEKDINKNNNSKLIQDMLCKSFNVAPLTFLKHYKSIQKLLQKPMFNDILQIR